MRTRQPETAAQPKSRTTTASPDAEPARSTRPGRPGHPSEALLALQRGRGNRYVQRLMGDRAAGGLPPGLRSAVEKLSGVSLADVRVHYRSARPASLGALAFTDGPNIHLAAGQERHLPHEAWHVVQQAQGRVCPTLQMKHGAVNDDDTLEREADVMGARAEAMTGPVGQPDSLERPCFRQPVAQRVRGGLEFTEDTAVLDRYEHPGPLPDLTANSYGSIKGAPFTAFAVPDTAILGSRSEDTGTLLTKPHATVELINDVHSAEWVIMRHRADVSLKKMKENLSQDIDLMFAMRHELAYQVDQLARANPSSVIAWTPGKVDNLNNVGHPLPGLFVYKPGNSKGKAQITVQFTKHEAIQRINVLNASKFVQGTKVAEGEDVSRVAGTESPALLEADRNRTTSFAKATELLGKLTSSARPVHDANDGALVLNEGQVGLIKLMVLNDALATTMTRYARISGEAQEKNIQRFFPKSRRSEYVRVVAGAILSLQNMTVLRREIFRTRKIDAFNFWALADAGALRVDEAFTEIGADDRLPGMMAARLDLAQNRSASDEQVANIKDAVLGTNGALLAERIARAAVAYTNVSTNVSDVISSTAGFTPVAGDDPGAVYEFREREVAAEEPTFWNRYGGATELKAALDALFGASE